MQGTRAHGDQYGWPDMPEEQIPSFRKYLRDHSPRDIMSRFTRGIHLLWNNVVRSYAYAEFVFVYVAALIGLALQNRKLWRALVLHQTHPCTVLFVVGYFVSYLILYAWYMPISSGNGFLLSLFLPFMLPSVRVLSYAQDHNMAFKLFGRKVSASSICPMILLFLTAHAISVFPRRVASIYGGR